MPGVLLFGGSFNPIHNGHLEVCRDVARQLAVERVMWIPCANPPHKTGSGLAPAADRIEMCRLACGGDPRFEVDDWETRQTGANYTLLTVRHYRTELGAGVPLYWLIGMDSLRDLPTWYRVGELAGICTLVTAGRPGVLRPDLQILKPLIAAHDLERIAAHILETPLVSVSATEIRRRVKAGESISGMTPPPVEQYIREHGLYED
jgi:nicotinate-nucleotide adenylyltransferase